MLQFSTFHDKDLEGLHFNIVPETIVHPIVGVQYTENEVVVLMNMGYRIDDRDSVPELDNNIDQGQDRLAHFDGEIGFPLFGHEAMELNTSMWKFMWEIILCLTTILLRYRMPLFGDMERISTLLSTKTIQPTHNCSPLEIPRDLSCWRG